MAVSACWSIPGVDLYDGYDAPCCSPARLGVRFKLGVARVDRPCPAGAEWTLAVSREYVWILRLRTHFRGQNHSRAKAFESTTARATVELRVERLSGMSRQ